LLIREIDAVAGIRPAEAVRILADLTDSDDVEMAEAADEAIGVAETTPATRKKTKRVAVSGSIERLHAW
jgi:hypothetical protein